MATTLQATTAKTLAEWAKEIDPDGKVAILANLLSQTNEILEDIPFLESNGATDHTMSQVIGLPDSYWRSYNMGIPSSKGQLAQVKEPISMLESIAQIDKDLAMLNGNTANFRANEDIMFLESMNQNMAKTLFYGNPSVDGRQFMGLAPRYNNLATTTGNSANILDAGGTGASSNASIWLIGWGENTIFCPFPKGSQAGLIQTDLGEDWAFDANNNRFRAFLTHYQWKNGLGVKDWRYAIRIANIAVNPTSGTPVAADLISLMSRALDRIPSMGLCKPRFYMNRTLFSFLTLQALNKSNFVLDIEDAMSQFGKPEKWTTFRGVPLRKVDGLTNTESQVTTSS